MNVLQAFRDANNPDRRLITKEQILAAKQVDQVGVFQIQNGKLFNTSDLGLPKSQGSFTKAMLDEYVILGI